MGKYGGHRLLGWRRGEVLILVLVDLGGKAEEFSPAVVNYLCLNPCFGGFGWESRPRDGDLKSRRSS